MQRDLCHDEPECLSEAKHSKTGYKLPCKTFQPINEA
jgi:hypothetical protein